MSEAVVMSVEHLPLAVVVHVLARNLVAKGEVEGLCSGIDGARATAPSLPFILDMAKVDFAGSLAMGTLVGLNQEFRARGQRLILVGLQANLHQALNITRINRIVEIMQDVPTALRRVEVGG
jgi:anti-anti-sigma factor